MKKLELLTISLSAITASQLSAAVMTAGDGFGTSSFNSAGQWNPSAAPSAGNTYDNAGFLLRTPATTNSYTFAGDLLTISGTGNFTAAANDALMWKGSGTGATITIPALTVNGGQLRHGQGDADVVHFAGTTYTVGPNGMGIATQGGMYIDAPISGTSQITVMNNGSGGVARTVFFTSTASTFNGNLVLNNANSFAAFTDNAVFNFAIGATGVSNSISGPGRIALDGDFVLDLSSASSALGDTWQLVDNAALNETYGSTFSVSGFTDKGNGTWEQIIDPNRSYLFDSATGALSVIPEPTSALLGSIGMLALVRRRRA